MNYFFNEAVAKTLNYEGGLSNDKYDAGGLTKYGISQRAYPDVDIKNLTKEQAIAIYKRNYWDANNCGEINHKMLALQVFDIAVNCGNGAAGKLLQTAVNGLTKVKLAVDGDIGPKTIAAVNSLDGKVLNNNLVMQRIAYYNGIVARKPTQKRFIKGWLRRAAGFTEK